MMSDFHLAQYNIGRIRKPLDHPDVSGVDGSTPSLTTLENPCWSGGFLVSDHEVDYFVGGLRTRCLLPSNLDGE
jgi:hypothetical protein